MTHLKELLYKIADDQLILGHRNSEWTGFGPLLEEDIAFSSMAQDKVGHSQAIYTILHQLGEQVPDTLAFMRPANQFHNCILVELPNGEYDFSLIRHFLFDTAEAIRFEMLGNSSYQPLAELARKIRGELRYHTLHANTWVKQLGSATEESISRLQKSLTEAVPYALGIFEESPFEKEIIDAGIFEGEKALQNRWMKKVEEIIHQTSLTLPDWKIVTPVLGGRIGKHSEHLQPLVDEMSEVLRIDPAAGMVGKFKVQGSRFEVQSSMLKTTMKSMVQELDQIINQFNETIGALSEVDFAAKPLQNKWSKKEVLGHLIDSAHNNLRRFICGQYEATPSKIVYDQDFWVAANNYQHSNKEDVIQLWVLMNKQICAVLLQMSEANYTKVTDTGKTEVKLYSLQFLAEDYVRHLKHHLNQIIPESFDIVYF